MGKADLHIHSNASDGQYAPQDLLKKVKSKGLQTISITDHDTIAGYLQAKETAAELEIELITGVEITSIWNSREVHLLAYCFDEEDSAFVNLLARQRKARRIRMRSIVTELNKKGVDIDYDEVRAIAHTGNVGRPHAASLLIKKGYVSSVPEAFIRYLSEDHIKEIQTEYAGIEEVVAVTKQAGGVVSVAHPGPIYSEMDLNDILSFGLDGIECIHPSHNFNVQRVYSKMAKSRNLLVTGGSDFHGNGKSDYDPYLGVVTLSSEHVEGIKRTARNRKQLTI